MGVVEEIRKSKAFHKAVRAEIRKLVEKLDSYPSGCEPARFGMKLAMLVAQYPSDAPAGLLENLGNQLVPASDEGKNMATLEFMTKYFAHLKAGDSAQKELDILDARG